MIRTFIDSDMFLLTLTVGLYCGGVALHPSPPPGDPPPDAAGVRRADTLSESLRHRLRPLSSGHRNSRLPAGHVGRRAGIPDVRTDRPPARAGASHSDFDRRRLYGRGAERRLYRPRIGRRPHDSELHRPQIGHRADRRGHQRTARRSSERHLGSGLPRGHLRQYCRPAPAAQMRYPQPPGARAGARFGRPRHRHRRAPSNWAPSKARSADWRWR